MAIDFFYSDKIIRLTPVGKETKEIADMILQGEVRVFPKLSNVRVMNLNDLWELRFGSSPSTYALYVYALYPVSYLLNAYELTGDKGYLDRAVSLALNFLDWERGDKKQINKKRSKILFGDHAVSNRTQVLCYLVCCLENENRELPEEVLAALMCNGEYLADNDKYSHYNHGLMMDLALLGLLNTFEGLKVEYPIYFKDNLVARLQHSITRDLTEDGVHVENSPGYHFWMLGFLSKITPPLEVLDKVLYLKSKEALSNASAYAKHITRPDGSLPTIGDTHANTKARPSKGLESRFFRHSNQVIFRSLDDKIWASFSSGYKTHVHKHCDNGAFILYYEGRDVLIDPGFLSYEATEDSLKIKESSFHNTPRPLSQDQVLKKADIKENISGYKRNLSDSDVISFVARSNIEFSVAKIADFSGESKAIFRLVCWVKPSVFVIYDKAIGQAFPIETFWHVAHHLSVQNIGGGNSFFDETGCLVFQLSSFAPVEVSGALPLSMNNGFYAKSFNEKSPSKILRARSMMGEICTVIDLCGGGKEAPKCISFVDGCVKIEQSGGNVEIDLKDLLDESVGGGCN